MAATVPTTKDNDVNHPRPVVIFGPFKTILNDRLFNDQPNKFGICVPHTSRPKRENEVEGREYYFTSREQMENDITNHLFIESGEYKGNLYGTTINAIREVAKTSKHCILDVNDKTTRRLIDAGFYPIVIFVRPRDVKWILDNMGEKSDEERAQQAYENSIETEQKIADILKAVIEEETLNDVYDRIRDVIDRKE